MHRFCSVDQFVAHWAALAPDRKAIISERSGEEICYSELDSLINHLCARYSDAIAPGALCVLYIDDSIVCHALLHAIFRGGGVAVPFDSALGEMTQENMLRHAAPKCVFAASDNANLPFLSGFEGLELVEFNSRLSEYRNALEQATPPPARAGLDDVAMIAYTSGTTSNSKGVVLTHRNLIAAYESGQRYMWSPRVVGCVFRIATLGTIGIHFFFPQFGGATVVMLPRLSLANAKSLWEAYSRHPIDFLYLVPSLVKMLNHVASTGPEEPRGVVVCGGSHLPPAHQELFQEKFGITLLNIYGLTESSFAVFFGRSVNGVGMNDIGPARSLVARVVDEHGRDVPDGVPGELWYKGEMVGAGYYNNPAATEATFHDKWLATGDIVVRDEQGNLSITGRKKDVIIRGGFNIHPQEVEEAILAEEGVVNAFVIGAQSDVMSEKILAYVHVRDINAFGQNLAIERIKKRLGSVKSPDRYLFSPREVPLNAAGKVDRRAVLELFTEHAQQMLIKR